MNESILDTIKKMLGLESDYDAFDTDIITQINAQLFTLNQIGVGMPGFTISDKTATWNEFFGEDNKDLEAAKSYIYAKVRVAFDPPSNSFTIEALNKQAEELYWRLMMQVEEGRNMDVSVS